MGKKRFLKKLCFLEQAFPETMRSGDLVALERLLVEVRHIVSCPHCHEVYRRLHWSLSNEELLDRLQHLVISAFSELEKAYVRQSYSKIGETELYLQKVSRFAEEESRRAEITSESRVLFVGCGALPVSAIALALSTGCRVVAVDNDEESSRFAASMVEQLGFSDQIKVLRRDGEFLSASSYSHVAIASLVPCKKQILENLVRTLPVGGRVLLRFGNGLYRLVNYELYETPVLPWRVLDRIYEPGHIHETLLLRKEPSHRMVW